MLSKDPIRIAGPLGRIYSFTRHYQGDDFFEGPRLAFHHDRAYARDHLLRLTRSVVDDPFNYRLLDVWQLVFQKPWTRPRNVNQLIADLTDKIHRGELFVYLEPDLDRDLPSLLRDGPPEGDGGFVDIGVRGYPADTPRTQNPAIITGDDEPQEEPVPQGEPEAYLQAHEGQQSEEGGWTRIGTVIGEGKRETFRAGPKIKIEGGDDRASIHLNNIPYKGTFTEIGPDGKPAAGIYPLYEGVLSTGLSGAFATDRMFELHGPDDTKFDWSFEIVPFEKSCDNCGQPMIKVYEWRE